jgi:hypothetical protein
MSALFSMNFSTRSQGVGLSSSASSAFEDDLVFRGYRKLMDLFRNSPLGESSFWRKLPPDISFFPLPLSLEGLSGRSVYTVMFIYRRRVA